MKHDDTKIIKINLSLFFTWDVSLSLWKEKGLLQREIKYYKALAKEGINVTFLTWGDELDLEIAKDLQNINIIPLYTKIPYFKSKVLRALLSIFVPWIIRDTLKTSDIIKTNQMWGGWCAVFSKFISKKPLIIRTGFELYNFTIRQGHGFLRKMFIWFISKITYKSADIIYLATKEDVNFVADKFKISKDKMFIRPNWIDTVLFKPLDIPKKDNHILFVGRLTEQKNLPVLIRAIADTPWTLDIVGDGEQREKLEQFAKNTNSNVNFLGTFSNDVLPEIYNSYHVFVLPSIYEGNPKTLLEAMACGCAVLGSNVDGIKSVIQNNKTGIVCEPTIERMRQSIELLLSDMELRNRLGNVARNQINKTQTLEKLVDKELRDYKMILKKNGN